MMRSTIPTDVNASMMAERPLRAATNRSTSPIVRHASQRPREGAPADVAACVEMLEEALGEIQRDVDLHALGGLPQALDPRADVVLGLRTETFSPSS